MKQPMAPGAYGVLTEPLTLKIERLLPGPVERVWAYLTDSDLRRQWLAAGEMDLQVGAPFELVWRNDELTTTPGERPLGFSPESRIASRILAVDPPRWLVFTWGDSSEVSFELAPEGDDVRLIVIHRRLPNRGTLLKVGAGWHAHLDILVARMTGQDPAPFWDEWTRLHNDYDHRIPA